MSAQRCYGSARVSRPERAERSWCWRLVRACASVALGATALACQAPAAREGAPREQPAPAQPGPVPASTGAPVSAVSAAAVAAPRQRQLFEAERACMGTRCTIAAFHDDEAQFDQAVNRALAEIARLDAMMTTWTPTSE